jgi:predicted SAM-dependent methyltransferase
MIPEHTKLNMGCGHRKLNDHWNVDIESKVNPDQVLDLEVTPWPFEDNFFDYITADNILEHLGHDPKIFTNIIKEMYRVSKDQAVWYVDVPHPRSDAFINDYTHVRPLTAHTFKMFDQSFNVECITKKLHDCTFGMYYNIDLEITECNQSLVEYWRIQQEHGMVGMAQLEINSNTMNNVVYSIKMFMKVHKPGRFIEWFNNQTKNT